MQGGHRRVEQGRAGNLHKVDGGEAAGMPKDAKPPSSSPAEHHEGKRAGAVCACCIARRVTPLVMSKYQAWAQEVLGMAVRTVFFCGGPSICTRFASQ